MKYTKRAVTIEAIQFDGTWDKLVGICSEFPEMETEGLLLEDDKKTVPWFGIKTLEGTMRCIAGDFVIKGIKGEYYPCKPDIFEASYAPANKLSEIKNPLPTEIERALNSLRYEIEGEIVDSIRDIILSHTRYVDISHHDSPILVKMNGEPIGYWQMTSVRCNLLVTPIFIPIDGGAVNSNLSLVEIPE
jgi:hypothetical protein